MKNLLRNQQFRLLLSGQTLTIGNWIAANPRVWNEDIGEDD